MLKSEEWIKKWFDWAFDRYEIYSIIRSDSGYYVLYRTSDELPLKSQLKPGENYLKQYFSKETIISDLIYLETNKRKKKLIALKIMSE